MSILTQAAGADIPLIISSADTTSERRITPSWTIAQLKAKLEPITGIPAGCQRLGLSIGSQAPTAVESADEEATQLASFPLQRYAKIHVTDTRPPSARVNYSDLSAVPKYTMPADEYESRSDSVLAWKKALKLGRFDPDAPSIEEQKVKASEREAEERGIATSKRCRLLPSNSDDRRGTIRYAGPVPEIPGIGTWVGIELDEPTGKNDGSVAGKRYFECKPSRGVFVRPERVEVGRFPPLDDLGEDMEEM